MDESKSCSRCKAILPIKQFGRRAASADGLHPYCKSCVSEYCRARYAQHAEEIKAAAQEYRTSNAQRIQQRDRARYAANKPKYAAASARYYAAHDEEIRAQKRAAREAQDKDDARAYKRSYRAANKQLRREWEHRRRARERASMVMPLTRPLIAGKVAYWGSKCWVCSGPFEAIDHVKPISKGGPHILANLRPICVSCNSRKHSTWPYAAIISTEG